MFIRTFLCCGHFLCLLCVFCFAIFCICSSGEDFIYPSLGCSVVYVWGLFSIIFPFTVTFSIPYNFNFRCPYFVSYISYHGYFSLSCHACILFCSIDPWILQNVCYSFHFIRLLTSWELQNLINNYHLNNKNNVWSLGPFGRLGISPSFSNIYPQRACTHFAIASNAHARIFFCPSGDCKFFWLIGQSVGTLCRGCTNYSFQLCLTRLSDCLWTVRLLLAHVVCYFTSNRDIAANNPSQFERLSIFVISKKRHLVVCVPS